MKDYYSILGLSSTASAAEIKRVYRRLAVMYHPDKNPSPEAESLFKEINEAYDVLSDPGKKQRYDQRLQNPFQELFQQEQEPVVQHRDPRYRGRRPRGFRPSASPRYTTKGLMKEYLPKVIGFSRVGALLGILLLLDFFLPARESTERVLDIYSVHRGGRTGHFSYQIMITDEGSIKLYDNYTQAFPIGSAISVKRTPVLSTVRQVSNDADGFNVELDNIYGPIGIVPFGMFITSILGLLTRRFNVEYSFNFSIVSAILLIISLYLIFAV